MTGIDHPRGALGRIGLTISFAIVVVSAGLLSGLVSTSLASPSPTVGSSLVILGGQSGDAPGAVGAGRPERPAIPRRGHRQAIGEADGHLPAGTTILDDTFPGIANLDADLLHALQLARSDAADYGVQLVIESGWRSRAYQAELLREAASEYGSEAEAARWVATPETSPHVSGDAVDIGASDAVAWLSEHGSGYGLCQIYGNEPWHFELRHEAITRGCPPLYADPTQDPRMRK